MGDTVKTTKIKIKENFPLSYSSTMYGANLNGVAINMDYIARNYHELAREILELIDKIDAIDKAKRNKINRGGKYRGE